MLALSIPMFNEADLAESVIQEIVFILNKKKIPYRIAVVNNGSRDKTGEALNRLAAGNENLIPIHLPSNKGYGGGILAGLNALQDCDYLWIGWMWGDGQISAKALPALLSKLSDTAEVAKICRIERHDGWNRWAVSKLYAATMKKAGVSIKDINGCPKIFSRQAFQALDLKSTDWFIDAEAMLKTEELGFVIHQEPAIMNARKAGKSKVNWQTCLEFLRNIYQWKRMR